MSFRDAIPADAAAIDAVFRESFQATFAHLYAPEDLANFLGQFTVEGWAEEIADPAFAFRVIEDAEGIAGYCKLGPISLPATPEGPALELRQLYLLDRAKGSGAAQALMDWALATARARGAAELGLSV